MSKEATHKDQVPGGQSSATSELCHNSDARTVHCHDVSPGGMNGIDISDGDTIIPEFRSRLGEMYRGEFEHAATWVLKVSAYANLERADIIRQNSHATRNVATVILPLPDNVGVDKPLSGLSSPKTGGILHASPASSEESIPTDPLPMIRDHPRTATGVCSSGLGPSDAHAKRLIPSQNHHSKNDSTCYFCGTVLIQSQGTM